MRTGLGARSAAVGAVLALAVAAAGCGNQSSGGGQKSGGGSQGSSGGQASGGGAPVAAAKIDIANYDYRPKTVTLRPGGHVTWTNHDSAPHTATTDDGQPTEFDTGTLKQGATKTLTVSKPGTYAYHCSFHAFMHGTVKVVR